MAFISAGYHPNKPMEGRITPIGPRHYEEFYPPVIKKNKGQWDYHEIIEPGLLMHKAKGGDEVYTVRCGGARLISVTLLREVMDIADKYWRRLRPLDHPQQHRVHGGTPWPTPRSSRPT